MVEQLRRGQPWWGHARAPAGGRGARFLLWLRRWAATERTLITMLAVAAVYFVTGRLGVLLAIPPGVASPVWLPSGVALAAVLLCGNRIWPGIWLGSFCVNVGILFYPGNPWAVAVSLGAMAAIATGSTLQALLAAHLTRRLIGSGRYFARGAGEPEEKPAREAVK